MKKYLLFFVLIISIVSCKNDPKKEIQEVDSQVPEKSFAVQKIERDSTFLEDCGDFPCPKIEVSYVELEGGGDFSDAVNQKNQEELITLLHINEEKPKANSVDEAIKAFGDDYFTLMKEFPDTKASYELILKQKVESDNENTFVLKSDFYIFTGGAHGYGGIQYLNFDPNSGKLLKPGDLITDMSAFTDYVEKAFRRVYEIPEGVDINSKGFFFEDGKFALPKNMAFTEDSVVLIYNPYEAASYSEGTLRFLFSKKEIGKWLKY